MTMINSEATGSRKKYLVPLVVLMLCAVALTGAGYAYTSTMIASDDVNVKSFEITLSDDGAPSNIAVTFEDLKFNTVISSTGTTYKADHEEQIVTFYLANNAVNTTKFTLEVTVTNADDLAAMGITVTPAVDSAAGADHHSVKFTFTVKDASKLSNIQDGKFPVELSVVATAAA